MKKALTISLLLLLFFSQAGYYLFYVIQQYQIKESIREELLTTLPESSLEIIDADANKNDIEWEEEGREFYLHGQMYDVAAIKKINGKTLIYCLNDKKEEQLLDDLSKAVSSSNDKSANNSHGHHTIKFQSPDYILFLNYTATLSQVAKQEHFVYAAALVSTITDINTPPPDLIF